jgi:GMP synthase (glutamine-hydrolysing)
LEDNRDASGRRVLDVWMSHGDHVVALPPGFSVIAASDNAPLAAIADESRRFYGLQFHPEVTHSLQGGEILRRFVREIAGCAAIWDTRNIIEDSVARIRAQVGADKVLLGLSGGVDSSVLAALLHRAVGGQLTCVFVDHGLLRLAEGDQVMAACTAPRIPSRSARSSAAFSSRCSTRRRRSSRTSSGSRRGPSIPT